MPIPFRALHNIEAGITYVNGPTIGAEAHMPFGGVKQTGNGHREGGWEVFGFYTETKTCYIDYSGKLQRVQIDNELTSSELALIVAFLNMTCLPDMSCF